MKVLLTTSVLPRWEGDSTPPFILNQARDLQAAGCDVTILAPHSPGSLVEEDVDGIRIVRFRYLWPEKAQSLCYEGGMNVRLRENPLRAAQLPFYAFHHWRALKKLLREPFKLIHAHSLLPQGWLATLAKQRSLPLVTSSHGADVYQLKSRWSPLLRKAIRASDALVANSQATVTRLIELGAVPEKIHRIPATPNYPDPQSTTHHPAPGPILLYAGRWIPEKGVDALVAAMPLILKSLPGTRLHLAGAGSLEGSLRHMVHEHGLKEVVNFLGWQDAEQLREEMQKASLLIAPSRVIEGQNLVVTEALSVGCPVATTPRGGVLDLIKDQETGIVIEDTQPEAIAKAVVENLANEELMIRLSKNGFSHFQRQFSREQITMKTMALYQSLTGKPNKGRTPYG